MRREWGQSDMLAYPVFYAARYMPASVRAVKTPSRKAKRSLTGCAASPIPSYRRKLNARSLIQAPLRRPGDAFAVRRLFAVEGPSGKSLLPGYLCSLCHHRCALEKGAKRLGELPGALRYYFFNRLSYFLGRKIPLEVLAEGHLAEVSR